MKKGKWILEHDSNGVRMARYTTIKPDMNDCSCEEFDSKEAMNARILELGFEIPKVEKEMDKTRFDELIAQATGG